MVPDQRLVGILRRFDARAWSGEVWRHTFADLPVDRPNTRGARWNPAGVPALYASLDRATALAEAEHMIAMQPLRPRVRRSIHRLHVDLPRVVDLTAPGVLRRLGVDARALASDDFTRCQAVGAAAAALGLDGIVVPSARSAGHNVVILLGDRTGPTIEVLESAPV